MKFERYEVVGWAKGKDQPEWEQEITYVRAGSHEDAKQVAEQWGWEVVRTETKDGDRKVWMLL